MRGMLEASICRCKHLLMDAAIHRDGARTKRPENRNTQCGRRQSTRAPEALTTGAHFAISLFTKAPNCSGVLGEKRAPSLERRAWMSGDCMMRITSAFQRRTMSG